MYISAQSDVEQQMHEAVAIIFDGVSLFSAHSDIIQPLIIPTFFSELLLMWLFNYGETNCTLDYNRDLSINMD